MVSDAPEPPLGRASRISANRPALRIAEIIIFAPAFSRSELDGGQKVLYFHPSRAYSAYNVERRVGFLQSCITFTEGRHDVEESEHRCTATVKLDDMLYVVQELHDSLVASTQKNARSGCYFAVGIPARMASHAGLAGSRIAHRIIERIWSFLCMSWLGMGEVSRLVNDFKQDSNIRQSGSQDKEAVDTAQRQEASLLIRLNRMRDLIDAAMTEILSNISMERTLYTRRPSALNSLLSTGTSNLSVPVESGGGASATTKQELEPLAPFQVHCTEHEIDVVIRANEKHLLQQQEEEENNGNDDKKSNIADSGNGADSAIDSGSSAESARDSFPTVSAPDGPAQEEPGRRTPSSPPADLPQQATEKGSQHRRRHGPIMAHSQPYASTVQSPSALPAGEHILPSEDAIVALRPTIGATSVAMARCLHFLAGLDARLRRLCNLSDMHTGSAHLLGGIIFHHGLRAASTVPDILHPQLRTLQWLALCRSSHVRGKGGHSHSHSTSNSNTAVTRKGTLIQAATAAAGFLSTGAPSQTQQGKGNNRGKNSQRPEADSLASESSASSTVLFATDSDIYHRSVFGGVSNPPSPAPMVEEDLQENPFFRAPHPSSTPQGHRDPDVDNDEPQSMKSGRVSEMEDTAPLAEMLPERLREISKIKIRLMCTAAPTVVMPGTSGATTSEDQASNTNDSPLTNSQQPLSYTDTHVWVVTLTSGPCVLHYFLRALPDVESSLADLYNSNLSLASNSQTPEQQQQYSMKVPSFAKPSDALLQEISQRWVGFAPLAQSLLAQTLRLSVVADGGLVKYVLHDHSAEFSQSNLHRRRHGVIPAQFDALETVSDDMQNARTSGAGCGRDTSAATEVVMKLSNDVWCMSTSMSYGNAEMPLTRKQLLALRIQEASSQDEHTEEPQVKQSTVTPQPFRHETTALLAPKISELASVATELAKLGQRFPETTAPGTAPPS
eukprot:Clim_evm29s33 gene=Clim_evmTU29s33